MGEGADEAEAVREDVRVEEGRRAVGEVTQKVAGEATQRVPRALGEAGKVVDEADVKGASEQAVEEWGAARNPKSGQNQLLAVFHGSMQNVDRSTTHSRIVNSKLAWAAQSNQGLLTGNVLRN